MSDNFDFFLEAPQNIDIKCLEAALERKKARKPKGFASFYTKEILYEIYYLWKKYDFLMIDITAYIKDRYNRKVDSIYLKKKLIQFEKKYLFENSISENIKNTPCYSILDKKPIKTTILEPDSPAACDSVLRDNPTKTTPRKTLTKRIHKASPSKIKKKVQKKIIKTKELSGDNYIQEKEVIESHKKSNSKDVSSTKDNESQNHRKIVSSEEVEVSEVISVEDMDKRVVAEETAKRISMINKLKQKKRKNLPLTLEEEQILWDDTVIDYSDPENKSEEIIVESL